ncbi:MAG: 3-keto-disaccharide hydrolase [Candidatus Sumerlaeaceae bacterium]
MDVSRLRLLITLALGVVAGSFNSSASAAADGKPLFNGTDIEGWVQRGGQATYAVEDGAIVGCSVIDKHNTFLCTKEEYDNFVLEFDCKVDGQLNSGVQFRSQSRNNGQIDRVYGYQLEIDPSARSWSGGIYDEGRRAKYLKDLKENEAARKAFKPDDWNHFRLEAVGDTFRTWVNDVPAAAVVDATTTSGFFGLQVHATMSTTPLKVRWRNLTIQQLEQPAPESAMLISGDWKGFTSGGDPVYAQVNILGGNKYTANLVRSLYVKEPPLKALQGESPGKPQVVFTADDFRAVMQGNESFNSDTNPAFEMKKIVRIPPSLGAPAPAGAVVLFDGSNLDQWQKANGEPAHWKLTEDKAMEVVKGSSLQTKRTFGDHQVHVEFRTPFMPDKEGQHRANSGVYLQGSYEIQVLDSYGLEGKDNECGGIYKVGPPRINMCMPPMEWQTFDITFRAARFGADDTKTSNAQLTVLHNGVCIHNAAESANATPGGLNKEDPRVPMPLMLQDHGNPVQFRNIWALDLDTSATQAATVGELKI